MADERPTMMTGLFRDRDSVQPESACPLDDHGLAHPEVSHVHAADDLREGAVDADHQVV